MQKATERIVDVIKTDPAVQNVMAFTGGGGATNGGFIFLGLKPFAERNATSSQVIDRLRPKLLSVSGANTFMQAGQDLRIGGRRKQRPIPVHNSERQPTGSGAVGPGAAATDAENTAAHRR